MTAFDNSINICFTKNPRFFQLLTLSLTLLILTLPLNYSPEF